MTVTIDRARYHQCRQAGCDAGAVLGEESDARAFEGGEFFRGFAPVAAAVRAADGDSLRGHHKGQRAHPAAADAAKETGAVHHTQ